MEVAFGPRTGRSSSAQYVGDRLAEGPEAVHDRASFVRVAAERHRPRSTNLPWAASRKGSGGAFITLAIVDSSSGAAWPRRRSRRSSRELRAGSASRRDVGHRHQAVLDRVTTPKLPPPPRIAQNRSGFSFGVDPQDAAVGGHHLGGEDVVDGRPYQTVIGEGDPPMPTGGVSPTGGETTGRRFRVLPAVAPVSAHAVRFSGSIRSVHVEVDDDAPVGGAVRRGCGPLRTASSRCCRRRTPPPWPRLRRWRPGSRRRAPVGAEDLAVGVVGGVVGAYYAPRPFPAGGRGRSVCHVSPVARGIDRPTPVIGPLVDRPEGRYSSS